MALNSLEDAFVHELGDILNAEKQIVRALPKVAKATSDPTLKESLEKHRQETERQVERLEQVFERLGRKARGVKCQGMKGILDEGSDILNEDAPPEVLDAMIIAACQKVEHYEICTYGTLCTWAEQLGLSDVVTALKQNLSEEKKADETLNKAASQINAMAAEPSEMGA